MSPFTGSAPHTERWQHLRLTLDDGVATVTLARPEKLNALTFGAYADLRDLLAELSREGTVRALVLAGEGRGFCSGGDVDEIIGATLAMDTAQLLDFNRMTGLVVRALRNAPSPSSPPCTGSPPGPEPCSPSPPTSVSPTRRPASPSSSPGSASPAATWAPPTCCPGSSASATPPGS